jgi:hypothetical protein
MAQLIPVIPIIGIMIPDFHNSGGLLEMSVETISEWVEGKFYRKPSMLKAMVSCELFLPIH